MIDPVAAAVLAVSSPSPAAIGWVFLAGVVTSVGPCIAPRYVALAAFAGAGQRPLVPTLTFVLGLICAFAALGFCAGLLGSLWSLSSAIYVALAVALLCGGCITLVRAVPPAAHDAHTCTGHTLAGRAPSAGGIFLLGAASALVLSPCCTPVVAAVVATSTAIGKPLAGAVLLVAYAAGHALPLFFAGHIGAALARVGPRRLTGQAPAIVGAVLMLALGLYYGLLA